MTMEKINILDKNVSNMIAAGEVVESPSSVVKELVENSIDAGAKSITVEIKDGGKSLIRVSDDGEGIAKDDVRNAFLRHGTSKIKSADDLKSIVTLGFRGEALSSIAAVSHTELMTKAINEHVGTHITIKAGEVIAEDDIGCPQGTTFIVKNLFYNTPARMKFLKKDSTEAGRVSDIMDRIVLSHPEVAFKYINNGKEIIFTPGNGDLKSCVLSIYGKEYAKSMLSIDHSADGIRIRGLAGDAQLARANRSFQSFFINGRFVKSNIFTYSVQEAYKNLLTVNRYPAIILHIQINPEMIDVNVHPTKMEVKFSNEQQVFNAILWAVKNTIYAKMEIPEVHIPKKNIFSYTPVKLTEMPKGEKFSEVSNKNISFDDSYTKKINEPIKETAKETTKESIKESIKETTKETIKETEEEYKVPDFKIVGQIFGTYIIIERENEMLLVDQHAAHERLKYEKLLLNYKKREINPQSLLVPIVLKLSSTEMETVKQNIELFEKIGFDVDDFGNNSIIIRQTPEPLDEMVLKDLIIDIIALIQDFKSENSITDMEYKVLYKVACRSALKANKNMHTIEMEKLILDLFNLENINTCPHGRPITIMMTKYTIEKEFKRV